MAVEVDGVAGSLGRVLITQRLQELGRVSYRVPGTKEPTELFDEGRVVLKPVRGVIPVFEALI